MIHKERHQEECWDLDQSRQSKIYIEISFQVLHIERESIIHKAIGTPDNHHDACDFQKLTVCEEVTDTLIWFQL